MWLERILGEIRDHDGPVALVGGEAYGAPFLIERLGRDAPLAWMRAAPSDAGDPVAQGNLLADALNRALGGPAFGGALPFAAHVRRLEQRRTEVAPLWLALSEAHHVPELAQALARVHGRGVRVVLDAHAAGALPEVHRLLPERLALRLEEARALAPAAVGDDRVRTIWRRSGGRMAEVFARVLEAAGAPAPTLPAPDGRLLAPDGARNEDPDVVVRALEREGRWIEALDLAVMAAPERVEAALVHAGPAYQEHGLLRRLHLLLSALPEPHRRGERALEWRLVAGFAAGDVATVLPDVDAHLAAFAAPAVRARRAGTLGPDPGLALAREALAAREDALTLFQAGRLEPDPDRAAELLLAAVRCAEDSSHPYDLVRNAGALGGVYLQDGRLDEAVAWLDWALAVHAERRIRDEDRRIRTLNELASARTLLGEGASVRASLEEAHASLEGVLPILAAVLRSTVASLAYFDGRDDEAAATWQAAIDASPRASVAHVALPYVLALLRWGDVSAARRLARRVEALSRVERGGGGTGSAAAASGALAVALVAWMADGADPRPAVAELVHDRRVPIERAAIAGVAAVVAGDDPEALPGRVRRTLDRVPDAILDRWAPSEAAAKRAREVLRGDAPALRLRFARAAGSDARFEGATVPLRGRLAEVALMLAEHPEGVSDQRLHALLVGDEGGFGLSALRTHVSRLRARLPVTASPYRFAVPFEVDVARARDALLRGRVREALTEAAGPVLPDSDAPGVRAARERWNEELRQAAIGARDADAILVLAERWDDDLELWEAAAEALADGDPRRPLVRARVRRLRLEFDLPEVAPSTSADGHDAVR